ncbi:MAG: NAD(P)/FAD-dependent oxidoreductase [Novosphingobium sp.]|nr:NAD(P)/FAD-dependent oxidoreductase [Novosphingobium sp.]
MIQCSANQASKPITESDEELASLFEEASPLVLALSAVHMSGSLDIIRNGPKTSLPTYNGDIYGSLSKEDAAALRARALEITKAWRDAGHPEPYRPNEDELHEMLCFLLGFDLPRAYLPMIREDMAFDAIDARAFQWTRKVDEAAKQAHPVAIIGAGMSGMLIGLRLKQAGIPFTILERHNSVGGTWFENRYPGLRVDVPSHSYSFSFIQDHRWSHLYAYQPELLEYFRMCRDRFGIADRIRYGVTVRSAQWNEAQNRWEVAIETADGKREIIEARSLVSACGFFNKTHTPAFEGRERFRGVQFHSGEWRDDVSLAGKRVAIIGNAATTLQMVPPVSEIASQLTIYQRSPSWTSVNPDYDRPIYNGEQWAIEHLPYFAGWMRAAVFNWSLDLPPYHMMIDPDWPQDGLSVSAANDAVRRRQTEQYERWLEGRPDLLEKLLPKYPPFVKRPTVSHGNFFEAVKRPNVEIVTDSITRLTERGIVDASGTERAFDIIIYATGYKVQEYISPIRIYGRGGIEINAYWQDRPGGYLGVVVPHFPNFYMMYGPGTNLGYNGNLIFNSELQARYIAYCIRLAIETGRDALEVREDVYRDYMNRSAEKLKQFVWSSKFGTTYFRNSAGHVTTNSPWSMLEMWTWLKEPDPDDFVMAEELAGAS